MGGLGYVFWRFFRVHSMKGEVVFQRLQMAFAGLCVIVILAAVSACGRQGDTPPPAGAPTGGTASPNASSESGLPKEWADYGKAGLDLTAEKVFVQALQVANSGDFAEANSLVDASMTAAFNQGSIDKYWQNVTKNGTAVEFTVTRVQLNGEKTKLRVTTIYKDDSKLHINQSLSKKNGKWILVND